MTPAEGRAGHDADEGPEPASISAGRVGRPHGLDGSFYVTRPRPLLLGLGAVVTVAGRAASIVRRAGTERRPIVRIEGVADREAAQELRGLELTVQRDAAPQLAEGEWWGHELEGCEVHDGELHLGTVSRMIELPSCEALEVQPTAGGAPLLVPMVRDAVREVDIRAGRIEVDSAFLDLAPEPARPGRGEDQQRRGGSS